MGTEKRVEMDSEIEWLSELHKELNVKRGKMKITVKLGYTENREVMYMEANVNGDGNE